MERRSSEENFLVKHFCYRLLANAPLLLYRLKLDWLLGSRFVRLHHRGRRTRRVHQVLLEVVRYDPHCECLIIASGWGARAQWYLNLLKYPEVEVDFAARRLAVFAAPLDQRIVRQELASYQRTHPLLSRCLNWLLGPDALEHVRMFRLKIQPARPPFEG